MKIFSKEELNKCYHSDALFRNELKEVFLPYQKWLHSELKIVSFETFFFAANASYIKCGVKSNVQKWTLFGKPGRPFVFQVPIISFGQILLVTLHTEAVSNI